MMQPRTTRASARRKASSKSPTVKPKRDVVRFKGWGKLRGTIATFDDGDELKVDAERLAQYLYFLQERNQVSVRRFAGHPRPWTNDTVLQNYRFTEVFRPFDRTSQYINIHVINEGDQSLEEVCFRSILFRIFGRISTWQYLCDTVGWPTWKGFDRARYVEALDHRLAFGESIYVAVYQTPAPTRQAIGGHSSHDQHLRLLDLMMRTSLPQRLLELPELCDQYHYVRAYPSMGPFLAFQLVLDLNMIEPLKRSHNWATPGPGAQAGLELILGRKLTEDECISALQWLQRDGNRLFLKAGYREADIPAFVSGQPGLTAVDHEHSLCEFSKYARMEGGTYGAGSSKYKYSSPHPLPVTRQMPRWWKSSAETERGLSYMQPDPIVGDDEEDEAEWDVSHIVTKDGKGDKTKYLVRWKGCPPSGDTWEAGSSLGEGAAEIVEEYEAKVRNIKDTQARIRRGSL